MLLKRILAGVLCAVIAAGCIYYGVTFRFFDRVLSVKAQEEFKQTISLPDNFTLAASADCSTEANNSLQAVRDAVSSGAFAIELNVSFNAKNVPYLADGPEYITKESVPELKKFLVEFEKENTLDGWAAAEMPKAKELLDNMDYLNQFGIYLTVSGKVISLSIGEIAGDTLFVHIEKALKEYAGAYPKTAQEFAKAFVSEKVKWINREEDCGDMGLRTSKTQYHPSEIRLKPFIDAFTAFDKITCPVRLTTERLIIEQNDGFKGYKDLCTDEEINEFWGFSYKDDILGEPTEEKFSALVKDLRDKKEEYSLVVKSGDKPVGEIVLWDFDYHGNMQIGFRFFKECQGKGYAFESVGKVIEYAFNELKVKSVRAYCFIENVRSVNLLTKLGFNLVFTDDKYKYFEKVK